MASKVGPRSVKDATRFTSTIPHAASKAATAAAVPKATPAQNAAAAAKQSSRVPGETPEQRVQRLRMAHLAAQRAQISQTDKIIDASRRFFDVAHKWTVGGLVLFTVVAAIVSIYSVWDMLRYNRARRNEWIETQRKLENDELAVARIAYLKDKATPEQIALVEAANLEAEAKGVKLPPLMAPAEHRTHFEEHVQSAFQGSADAVNKAAGKGVLGIFSGFLGGNKQDDASTKSTSEAIESTTAAVQNNAQQAWDRELENQRRGGSLDQLGLATAGAAQPAKKGWWPW